MSMRSFAVRKIITATSIAAFAAAVNAASVAPPDDDEDLVPTGKGWGQRAIGHGQAKGPAAPGSNGIFYHGGPLLLQTPGVYYIWYGNWSGNTATTILTDLAQSIGGSPYFHINTTYSDGSSNHVSGSINFLGSTSDNYSLG